MFFQHVEPLEVMKNAVIAVFDWLYTLETVPREVESIVLVLRSMPGCAHTMGSDVYKEIHLSLDYVQSSASRAKDEILGVITHEMVHCFQFNGKGSCPGGLVEGIADWVRLHAGLAPPHWKEGKGGTWDAGYEATGFFLDWVEQTRGRGFVRTLNLTMRDREYEEIIFKELAGRKVTKLWKLYREHLDGKEESNAPEQLGSKKSKKHTILRRLCLRLQPPERS